MLPVSESLIQCAIVEYLGWKAHKHKFMFYSVPNESMVPKNGKKFSGAEYGRMNRLKSMGLTAGVSDLVIVHKGYAYHMEVKRPGGQLTEAQRRFRQDVYNCGSEYAVVRSVDEAINALKVWNIIK